MATIDKYGIQYGNGNLYPLDNPGGTTDPTTITNRRTKGNSTSYVSGGSTSTPADLNLGAGQDLLNAIQMGNLGTGSGVYGRRESNTFYFKSLVAGDGIALSSTSDSIVITATGTSSGGGNGSIVANDTRTIDFSGDGLSSTPLTAEVKLSADANNILVINQDGLYATSSGSGSTGPQGPKGDTGAPGATGPKGDKGDSGTSLEFKGAVLDAAALPPTGNTEGDAWIAGSHVYIYTNGAFVDGGEIVGPAGPQGLTGEQGVKGDTGTAPVIKGTVADQASLPTTGNSQYDGWFAGGHLYVYLNNGYQDMGDLKGPQGIQGIQGIQGLAGSAGVKGDPGDGYNNAVLDSNNHLILTKTAGGTTDVGQVAWTKLVQQTDVQITPTSADNGKAVIWNNSTGKFVLGTAGGSGSSTFVTLTDAPQSYTGGAGKLVAVNSGATGLEFVANVDSFLELTDAPHSYAGAVGKHVRVNSAGNALEFALPTFLELNDTPASFSGMAGKVLAVNSAANAVEFVDAPAGKFTTLSDVSVSSLVGQGGKVVSVNTAGNALVLTTPSSGGLTVKTFRVNMNAANIGSVQDVPAGWTVTLEGTNNTVVRVVMDVAANVSNVSAYGFATAITTAGSITSGFNRKNLDSSTVFDVMHGTTFAITSAAAAPFGASTGSYAIIEVLLR